MIKKKLSFREKERKTIRILKEAYANKDGNVLRLLNKTIAKYYQENPVKLKRYFKNKNELISGIATSAYHSLTGDITPITKIDKGGLGAIIHESEENLKFGRHQLHFSKISGDALKKSKNKGYSFWNSIFTKNACEESINSEHSIRYSEFHLGAGWKSTNSGNSLWYCKFYEHTLWHSNNVGDVLKDCRKEQTALKGALNSKKVEENLSKKVLI